MPVALPPSSSPRAQHELARSVQAARRRTGDASSVPAPSQRHAPPLSRAASAIGAFPTARLPTSATPRRSRAGSRPTQSLRPESSPAETGARASCSLEPVLPQQPVESRARHAKDVGGAILLSFREREYANDVIALEGVERRQGIAVRRRRFGEPQVVRADDASRGDDSRARQTILEFAHVARPR